MLQRGVNYTHFQIAKPYRSSSLLFEIHPSLKQFFQKVPPPDPNQFRPTKTLIVIHFWGVRQTFLNIHMYIYNQLVEIKLFCYHIYFHNKDAFILS